MIKQITYLIFLFYGINLYGQYEYFNNPDSLTYSHIINSDTFPGTLPEFNNITGNVSQFRTLYYSRELELMVRQGEEKLIKHYDITQEQLFGQYLSGKKTGKWEKIIHDGSSVFSEYTVFKTDTVIFTSYFPYGREFYYIGDSSIIYGRINKQGYSKIAYGLTIEFRCKKSDGCIYKTPDQKVLTKSDFEDLERVITEIEYGLYNRKLKEIIK